MLDIVKKLPFEVRSKIYEIYITEQTKIMAMSEGPEREAALINIDETRKATMVLIGGDIANRIKSLKKQLRAYQMTVTAQ